MNADTRGMRIVHTALRRDLARARAVLGAAEPPHPEQRKAIAAHLVWMLEYLHEHHTNEETWLFPLVRARDPHAAALLDTMDHDHAAVAITVPALIDAAKAYGADESALDQIRETLDALCDTLLPHLRREEDELMPLVERTVTKAEWDAWEAGIVASQSKKQLAALGLWTLDGQEPEDAAFMAALVPPVPRWIILNVLVRGYRKRAFACWWDAEHSPWKLRPGGSVSVVTSASPEQVWDLLTDVGRIGEWSHECHTARWLDDSRGVGARFTGSNRSGWARWARTCTVTAWEPGRRFAYSTSGGMGDRSLWGFRLERVEGGTRVTQTFRMLAGSRALDRLIWTALPRHRDRVPALQADLERLATVAVKRSAQQFC